MAYVEGFVAAVPTANRDAYQAHAEEAAALFGEFGATRLVETWGDDVPRGKLNDFWGAVQAKDDETVVFSWIEYPDRATRDAANARMMDDPRMSAMTMPFDGARMIYGGFAPVVDEGRGTGGYVDGFLVPVSPAKKDAYREMAQKASAVFRDHGALRVVEAWGDSIEHGKQTDYYRATHAQGDETIVFSWIEWADKAAHDAGMQASMADERMKTAPADMPFDGTRMIYGGFAVLLDK